MTAVSLQATKTTDWGPEWDQIIREQVGMSLDFAENELTPPPFLCKSVGAERDLDGLSGGPWKNLGNVQCVPGKGEILRELNRLFEQFTHLDSAQDVQEDVVSVVKRAWYSKRCT